MLIIKTSCGEDTPTDIEQKVISSYFLKLSFLKSQTAIEDMTHGLIHVDTVKTYNWASIDDLRGVISM